MKFENNLNNGSKMMAGGKLFTWSVAVADSLSMNRAMMTGQLCKLLAHCFMSKSQKSKPML